MYKLRIQEDSDVPGVFFPFFGACLNPTVIHKQTHRHRTIKNKHNYRFQIVFTVIAAKLNQQQLLFFFFKSIKMNQAVSSTRAKRKLNDNHRWSVFRGIKEFRVKDSPAVSCFSPQEPLCLRWIRRVWLLWAGPVWKDTYLSSAAWWRAEPPPTTQTRTGARPSTWRPSTATLRWWVTGWGNRIHKWKGSASKINPDS